LLFTGEAIAKEREKRPLVDHPHPANQLAVEPRGLAPVDDRSPVNLGDRRGLCG
jgi:hypothetical protein